MFRVLMLSLTILLVGGGVAAFCLWHQGSTLGHASSDSVVGPPSLPAATVDAIFRRLGSPMAGTGQAVEAASRASNIDDAFALAVWWTETNDGEAGVGRADRNPGSVRGSIGYPSAYDGYTIYPSYTAAVNYWFSMMKRNYINRGLTTVSAIAHPYVGTSTSYLWAGKVTTLMNRYRAEAPPPTATPKPTPTVPASLQRVQQSLAQKKQEQTAGGPPAPTSAPVSQQAVQSSTFTLGSIARPLLVLLALLVALALALWAWRERRRTASRPLPQPLVQSTENLWADLRASRQRPSVFFGQHSLSGLLPTTDDLPVSVPSTGTLGMADPAFAEALPAPHVFTTEPQTSSFAPSFTAALSLGVPDTESVEQLPFDAPVTPFANQFADLDTSPQSEVHPAHLLASPTTPMPATNGLHRTRLQAAAPANSWAANETPARLPQPVSASSPDGRSGGLLSRYREMQALQEGGE
jgi:hypothetical protein